MESFSGKALKAVMMDIDGVLVKGRPEDGKHWSASLERDLKLSPSALQREFFEAHWNDIVVGRANLMQRLRPVLRNIAPHLSAEEFAMPIQCVIFDLDGTLVDSEELCNQEPFELNSAENRSC